jgi:uncharacterized repeat protein (TIGR03943 family)
MQVIERLPNAANVQTRSLASPQPVVKTAVLAGLSLYFVAVILSGNLPNYINQRFSWLAYVAAVLLAALAAVSAFGMMRIADGKAMPGSHQRRLSWWTLAIVAVPLILGLAAPSTPLGADAVNGSISMTAVSLNSAVVFQRDPLDRNVLDWIRLFQNDLPAAFNGQEADVIGFVYREPDFPASHFMVARFTISCCVADANAIGVPVRFEGSGELEENTWVRVRGAFEAGDFRGTVTPILAATNLEVVEEPKHPYLYP